MTTARSCASRSKATLFMSIPEGAHASSSWREATYTLLRSNRDISPRVKSTLTRANKKLRQFKGEMDTTTALINLGWMIVVVWLGQIFHIAWYRINGFEDRMGAVSRFAKIPEDTSKGSK